MNQKYLAFAGVPGAVFFMSVSGIAGIMGKGGISQGEPVWTASL